MPQLLAASLIWSFSFGIIQQELATLPPAQVALLRLLLAALLFLPLLRLRPGALAGRLMAIGAVQYGLMYLLYLAAYRHLQVLEIILFTVFTPVWVRLLEGFFGRQRGQLRRRQWWSVAAAVAGAAIVASPGVGRPGLGLGFVLVQGANLCFAAGQVAYRHLRLPREAGLYAWLYVGSVLVALVACLSDPATHFATWPDQGQWLALLYLGLISSGLAFFLWNQGARRVKAGTLAVANNLKIPLGLIVSLLFFARAWPSAAALGGCLLVFLALAWEATRSRSEAGAHAGIEDNPAADGFPSRERD